MLSRMLTRREQAVIAGFTAAVIVGATYAYWRMNRQPAVVPAAIIDPLPVPPKARPAVTPAHAIPDEREQSDATVLVEPEEVAVAIQGAVKQPGLYRLDNDARVQDLIDAADGLIEGGDVTQINLAAELIDGTTLTIPKETKRGYERAEYIWNPPQYTVLGQLTPVASQAAPARQHFTGQSASTAQAAGGPLDLNRATAEDLESLPGIGPVLAAAIVDYRGSAPFASVEDLLNVSGIGPKRLDAIRPLVSVE